VNPRLLYRSADDRILAGVAGGLADYLDVDPVIVRIIWFLSIFFTGTLTFWAYLVMIIVVPLEPSEWPAQSPWAPGGAPGSYPAGYTPPTAADSPPVDAAASPDGQPAASSEGVDPAAGTASGPGPAPAPGMPPAAGAAPGGSWSNDWRWQWRQERWQARANRWQQRAERREHSRGGPGLVFGLLLILIGGMLAWHQFDPSFDFNLTWPVVIIAFGGILVLSSVRFRDR
jgi:phage shock protein PspC (stress-responsive transcriptional regulator)